MKKHIVCIASIFKGNEFLEECHEQGWHVTLVTPEKLLDEQWSWISLNQVKTFKTDDKAEDIIRIISNLAGSQPIDRIVGLDEFDVLTAAKVREHLQIEGISNSYALRFRDKLRMRHLASSLGLPCPDFSSLFRAEDINAFLDRSNAPWIIKPRTEVSAFGIKKCETREEVWETLKELDARNTWRDHPTQYLIEQFITGKVFHVDSVVNDGKIVASGVSEYGTPPMTVAHQGGVFTSYTIPYKSKIRKELEKLNKQLLKVFEYERGVAHAEFLQSEKTGEIYLLEVAARVGGAHISDVLEQASGFNLWREWAKLVTATPENPYQPPKLRQDYAGIALALANDEKPDTRHYDHPEIVYRVNKPRHVGLIFYSKKAERVGELLGYYSERIAADFLAVAPVKQHYDD